MEFCPVLVSYIKSVDLETAILHVLLAHYETPLCSARSRTSLEQHGGTVTQSGLANAAQALRGASLAWPSKYCGVHKWAEGFPSSLPSPRYSWKKAVRLGFYFSCCSLKRFGFPTNLLLLAFPLCPDHSSCSSPAHRVRENSRKGWGQCQPSISVLSALNAVTSSHPWLSKRLKKCVILQFPSTILPSGCHSRLYSLN